MELNNVIPEAITKNKNRSFNIPAFYTITTKSGKVYAGSTGSINKRLSGHKGALEKGEHLITGLQVEYSDVSDLQIAITYAKDREEAFDKEQSYLDENFDNPNNLNRARNARFPGQGVSPSEFNIQRIKETHTGKTVSEETRIKLREARKSYTVSEETKEKLRIANTGKKLSEETREKISLAGIGRVATAETCRKISEAKKGKGMPQAALAASLEIRSRSVLVGGNVYPSMTAAAKELGVTDVTVRNWAKNPNIADVCFEEDVLTLDYW